MRIGGILIFSRIFYGVQMFLERSQGRSKNVSNFSALLFKHQSLETPEQISFWRVQALAGISRQLRFISQPDDGALPDRLQHLLGALLQTEPAENSPHPQRE
jgi:hypothetical protein